MKAKQIFFTTLKLIALTLILFIVYTIASNVAGLSSLRTQADPAKAGQIALIMLGTCFLETLVIAYPVLRSRWTGWRLVLTIFGVFFGIATFLSQIESVVFLNVLVKIIQAGTISQIVLQGFIVAALYAPLAVLVLGKMGRPKIPQTQPESGSRLPATWIQWTWKISLIAVIYFIIYISFGYFVAWQSPEVREFYANLQMPPWMLPFQLLRGLIWAGLAIPVIAMMKGQKWEAGMAVALLYSVLMGIMLILPNNPIMPDAVRIAHFKEIMSSNFLFGWLVVLILSIGPKKASVPDTKTKGVNSNG